MGTSCTCLRNDFRCIHIKRKSRKGLLHQPRKQNRAAQEELPGLLLSCIINLHKTDIKRAARAGLFDVLKNHAFCMSPLRLNREMLMFGTPGLPSLVFIPLAL